MPFWFVPLITLGIKAVAACACFGAGCYMCNKVISAVKGGQKLKELKYKDREVARQAALEANKKAQTEREEKQKKVESNETKIQELEKKSEEAHRNSKNPNLSEEERAFYRSKARQYDDEINRLKQENRNYHNQITDLDNQIKNNNKVIDSTSRDSENRQWIWEVLTLENILICLAIYATWKIVRDESR